MTTLYAKIKQAQAAIAGSQKLLDEVTGQIYGGSAASIGRRRGRPARATETAAATGPEKEQKVKPNLPAILRARGALTREQIIAATGWKSQAANLQLSRLKETGQITEEGELYSFLSEVPTKQRVAKQRVAA